MTTELVPTLSQAIHSVLEETDQLHEAIDAAKYTPNPVTVQIGEEQYTVTDDKSVGDITISQS